MPRAVLKNGVIYPLEPLPPEWADGQEVVVQATPEVDNSPEVIERWEREMERLCADIDPEDEARMLAAIAEHRREDKAGMRREMGLPE
jgi:hypothetical protein